MKILIARTPSRQLQKTIDLMKEKMEAGRQNLSPDASANNVSNIEVEIWNGTKLQVTCADIKKAEADLFIDFNLAGFEQSTLTDGIAYNLLNCKQIHILLKGGLPMEKYLAKQLSISMFFYCVDSEYCRYLQDKYPDIPYLKSIAGWKREEDENGISENSILKNAEILCDIVCEVAQICRMLP